MRRYFLVGFILLIALSIFASAALCEDTGSGDTSGNVTTIDPLIDLPPPMYEIVPEEAIPEYGMPEFPGNKQYTPDTVTLKVKNRDNGIVVGQPKLFELRSIQKMIDSVKANLAQASMPNTSQLFGMTGRIQGIQNTSSTQSIQVTGNLTGSGNMTAAQPNVQDMRGDSGSDFEARSTLALAPTDVLAEQTSLWHQLVNLQMLLDGALSDRLIPTDENGEAVVFSNSVKYSPRAQAIVGFQISVDPRQEYRDAVAEATITIDNKKTSLLGLGGYGDEPSLMMLLPQQQTYNSVSISKDSKSFGFGSLVNVLSFGAATDKRKEAFYIGKDTDTVALEKIPGLPANGLEKIAASLGQTSKYRGVSFGWQFRPVFNRAVVQPGVRQVFAMVSLPASLSQEKWEGKVRITTYWRRYDRRTGSVGKPIEGSVNEWKLDDIVVPIGSGVEEALEPQIAKAQWEDTGGGNVAITIEGSNFSLGTDVACGDVTLHESDLSLSSAKRIRFLAPASAIGKGEVTLIGRYGTANLRPSIGKNDDPYKGIEVSSPQFTQQDDQTTAVELTLSKVQNPARLLTDRRPVVQIDGQLFGVGDKPFTSISVDESQQTATIRFGVPTQTLAKTRELIVRDLVGPASISVKCGTDEGSCIAHKAVVLSTGNPVSVAVFGSGFRDDVKVQVGGMQVTDLRLNSAGGQSTVITFDIDMETALNAKYILVTQGSQSPMLIPFSMPAVPGQ